MKLLADTDESRQAFDKWAVENGHKTVAIGYVAMAYTIRVILSHLRLKFSSYKMRHNDGGSGELPSHTEELVELYELMKDVLMVDGRTPPWAQRAK